MINIDFFLWQLLDIIFPILQVTKIKAERLNALWSATGEEQERTKRLQTECSRNLADTVRKFFSDTY